MSDKTMLTLRDLQILAEIAKRNGTSRHFAAVALQWAADAQSEVERLRDVAREGATYATKHQAEVLRLTAELEKANDQAEHFERLWYLTNEDAARYAFAKTLEGQVVTMETFKVRGAAELDQALDEAMVEAADAHNEADDAARKEM